MDVEDVEFSAFLEDDDEMELDSAQQDESVYTGNNVANSIPEKFSAAWARPSVSKIVPEEDDLGEDFICAFPTCSARVDWTEKCLGELT